MNASYIVTSGLYLTIGKITIRKLENSTSYECGAARIQLVKRVIGIDKTAIMYVAKHECYIWNGYLLFEIAIVLVYR